MRTVAAVVDSKQSPFSALNTLLAGIAYAAD